MFAWRGALIGHTEVRADNSTVVEFTLAAEGDQTRLRVVESGFASLACSAEQRTENAAGNTRGWGIELGELQDYATRVAA